MPLLTDAQISVLGRDHLNRQDTFYPGRQHQACRSLVALGMLTEHMDKITNPVFRFTDAGWQQREQILLRRS